jgi:uncharacterized membrane protein YfcA
LGEPLLIIVAFFTSTLTGIVGLGGGLLLISAMPGFLPVAAVVPVHGGVQLASNVSRALFDVRVVAWRLVGPFSVGAVLGAALGSRIVVRLPAEYFLPLLGLFVLVLTWGPAVRPIRLPGGYVVLGGVATFLSLFVGAVGPVCSPFLLREQLTRDGIVATQAVWISVLHSMKLVTFGLLGFAFGPYLFLMSGMIAAAVLGSWVGRRLRGRVPEHRFRTLFRILLTLLALRMLLRIGL